LDQLALKRQTRKVDKQLLRGIENIVDINIKMYKFKDAKKVILPEKPETGCKQQNFNPRLYGLQ
jgi:hypothetical protein